MRSYRNPTQDEAIGEVNREWKEMARLAVTIREGRKTNPVWVESKKKLFTGIYKRLLEDPIEEVKKETRSEYR